MNFQLPYPLMNIINGGAHANNGLRIQEFMIRPDRAKSFSEAMRVGFLVIKSLSKLFKDKGLSTSVGDEGGFAPMISSNNQALDLIVSAIKKQVLKMVKMFPYVLMLQPMNYLKRINTPFILKVIFLLKNRSKNIKKLLTNIK